MFGAKQQLMYPAEPSFDKPDPNNPESDGKMLSFPTFVDRYQKQEIGICKIDLDLDDPLSTASKLGKEGFSGAARALEMQSVPLMYRGQKEILGMNANLVLYHRFLDQLGSTVDLAREKYGLGKDSPILKELEALRKTTAEVRKMRLDDLKLGKYIYGDIDQLFLGKKKRASTELGDVMDDAKNRELIRQTLGMGDQDDNDPRWRAAFKTWTDSYGFEPKVAVGPKYTKVYEGHFNVLKGWQGVEDKLRCG